MEHVLGVVRTIRCSYKEVQEDTLHKCRCIKAGEQTAGIHPGSSAEGGLDLMQREVSVWPLAGYVARG